MTRKTPTVRHRLCAMIALLAPLLAPPQVIGQTTDECPSSAVRWASSSNRIYVSGLQVRCSIPGIYNALTSTARSAALQLVSPGVWLLRANLHLENGATLLVHGPAAGGETAELRLKSNNSSAANSIVYIRVQWGALDVEGSYITSWDELNGGPDTEYATYKRSYIHARSLLEGTTPRESTMSIRDSTVSHLGYKGAEAYGLVWKVYGTQADIFDLVNIYGEIRNSTIHNNYFGVYTYGAYGMVFDNNIVRDNIQYGLDPHDDSDSLTITNNLVYNNGNHGIICSKRCDNLVIDNNQSYGNSGNGIMLHRLVVDSFVRNNHLTDNTDAGIALFESHRNVIEGNTVVGNLRGIRFSVGSQDNVVRSNLVQDNTDYGLYFYKGSDIPWSGDGRPKYNILEDNQIENSGQLAIKLSDADENRFLGNSFLGLAGIELRSGHDNLLSGNTIPADLELKSYGSSAAPGSVLVETVTPVKIKLDSYSQIVFQDVDGLLYDADASGDTNAVTAAGTSLTLDTSVVGSTATVSPRASWVTVDSGDAMARVIEWKSNPGEGRSVGVKSDNRSQAVTVSYGGLPPNTDFSIFKDGVFLAVINSGSQGRVEVDDVLETRNIEIEYRLTQ